MARFECFAGYGHVSVFGVIMKCPWRTHVVPSLWSRLDVLPLYHIEFSLFYLNKMDEA